MVLQTYMYILAVLQQSIEEILVSIVCSGKGVCAYQYWYEAYYDESRRRKYCAC